MALPPGPKTPYPLALYRWIKRPTEVLDHCFRTFGDTFTMRFPANRFAPISVVVTCHPETIKQVFTGPGEFLHAGKAAQVLGPVVGQNSVLLLDGKKHLRHRRLLLPPFHGERMREYVGAMRSETVDEIARIPTGVETPMHPHFQQITLRIILRTVLGVEDPASMAELGKLLTRVLDVGADPALLVHNLVPIPTVKKSRFFRLLEAADSKLYELIRERRRQGDLGTRTDVLSMLLEARDEDGRPMNDAELRDELMTLLVAGHETTATAVAWAIHLLMENPEALERATSELDDAAPEAIASPSSQPFMEAVIRETLRMRPVIPMVGRVLQVPMTFRGFRLPAGTVMAPNIWLTHYHPELYDEPRRFKPERFLGTKPNPYTWFPFGGGIRRCIGQAFALLEMKVLLSTLLRHLELRPVEGPPVRIERRAITFAPSDQTRVFARRRTSMAA